MPADSLREQLARTLRVAHRLGFVGLLGHASVRVEGAREILVTPGRGPGSPSPNRVTAGDVLGIDLDGRVARGGLPPPRDLAMHLAIYRCGDP